MDISLLHAGLAAGAALAALPVILHLFMKQKPKHIIFPALRLIKERHKRSKKKLKIKNWLLLLARMAVIALMALALARPTIYSQTPIGDAEVPTAMALVFDTSLSMEYTERGNNRLAEAKLRALDLLKRTTENSEIFVFDTAEPVKQAALTPAAARKRIDALNLRAANRPINIAVLQAYAVVGASSLTRREVYVLTDLARSAWDLTSPKVAEEVKKVAEGKNKVNTYVLRLTPKEVQDVAVVKAEPATAVATQGEPLEIRATVRASGKKASRVLELRVDGVPREKKPIDVPENGQIDVTFQAPPKLDVGLHQGEVRLTGEPDFMKFDDARYFSFRVQPAYQVLLISQENIDSTFIQKALQPDAADLPPGLTLPFKVETIRPAQFASKSPASLKNYATIFVLNVDRLGDEVWSRLNTYVREGGGLVIAAGNRTVAQEFNGGAAASLMPATLLSPKSPEKATFFGEAQYDHPLLKRHPRELESFLASTPIYRFWEAKPGDASRVLIKYTDGSPALIERTFQGSRAGHVLLWTTPLSRRPDRNDPAAWNEFPQSYAFFELALETVPYLAGTSGETLNYEAGEDVLLPLDPARRASRFVVRSPDDPPVSDTISAPVTDPTLRIYGRETPGNWSVKGTVPDGSETRLGFSVNPSPKEAEVVALETADLDNLFGKDLYQLADDPDSLKRALDLVMYGSELFPWLMFLILVVITLENLLANRFNREVKV